MLKKIFKIRLIFGLRKPTDIGGEMFDGSKRRQGNKRVSSGGNRRSCMRAMVNGDGSVEKRTPKLFGDIVETNTIFVG